MGENCDINAFAALILAPQCPRLQKHTCASTPQYCGLPGTYIMRPETFGRLVQPAIRHCMAMMLKETACAAMDNNVTPDCFHWTGSLASASRCTQVVLGFVDYRVLQGAQAVDASHCDQRVIPGLDFVLAVPAVGTILFQQICRGEKAHHFAGCRNLISHRRMQGHTLSKVCIWLGVVPDTSCTCCNGSAEATHRLEQTIAGSGTLQRLHSRLSTLC